MSDGDKQARLRRDLERENRALRQYIRQLESVPGANTGGSASKQLPNLNDPDSFIDAGAPATIETRVGVEWLTRTAAFLLLTAAVIGFVQTLSSPDLTPMHKLGVLYTVSLIATVYGVFGRRSDGLLPKVSLGGGLAGTYYATYAIFFVEPVRVVTNTQLALPALLVALACIAWVIAWRQSQTAAGITLFLVYYTIIASASEGDDVISLYYGFGAGALCAGMALWFMAAYRWYLVSWLSLAAIYGTHAYFFWPRIDADAGQNSVLFWSNIAFLSLCFFLLATGGVIEARARIVSARGTVAMAIANAAIFSFMTGRALGAVDTDPLWVFAACLTVTLSLLALYAETIGPATNLLYQSYVAMGIIAACATIGLYFMGAAVWIGLAAMCLLLAVVHNMTGIVIVKIMNLAVLGFTAAGAMLAHRFDENTVQLPAIPPIPESWLCVGGVTGLLAFTAWYYHSAVTDRRVSERLRSGHWFLADTPYNLPASTVAMIHAAAVACVLITGIIMLMPDRDLLPLSLTIASAVIAVAGMIMSSPQVTAAAIGPVIAAQVAWYFNEIWLMPDRPAFAVLAGISAFIAIHGFLSCYLWETYVNRDRRGPAWEVHLVSGLPYTICSVFAATAIYRIAPDTFGMHMLAGIAIVFMFASAFMAPTAMLRIAAPTMIATGSGFTLYAFLDSPSFDFAAEHPAIQACVLAAAAIAGERLLAIRSLRGSIDVPRLILLGAAGIIGLAVLERYAPPELRTAGWIGLAVAALLAGVMIPEAYYRLLALGLIAATSVRAFTGPDPWQARTFALLGTIVLAVSWYYSHEIARRNQEQRHARRKRSAGR